MIGSVGATLLGLLLQILFDGTAGQQLLLARPQRSLFEAPLEHADHLDHLEHLAPVPALPPLGWNAVGGGLGLGVGGEWAYNPVGLGHMSRDDLLTLLEAWKEVEQESAASTTTTTAAPPPPPVETTTRRPVRPLPPLPPPPPPPPRPIPIPIPLPVPAPGPQLPSGTPITVRLPAFVPVRLAAMWTQPAGGAAVAGQGAGAPAGAAAAGGDEGLATDDAPDEDAAPRLFRFMPMPLARGRNQVQAQPQARQQFVVRNTLDSVDVGTAPVRTLVRPEVKPKIEVAAAAPAAPAPPGPKPAPFFRPKSGLPPHLANARFELVPSSQIIGDWRE
ncbi:hypothetical protein KR054_008057 [Drosophila jambulina]|nr:hypothetical protein KR054_008057 [Drosophila jambulina]